MRAGPIVVDALRQRRPPLSEPCFYGGAMGAAARRLAVDMPTGADATAGGVDEAGRADCTVTFIAPKLGRGHLSSAGLAGDVLRGPRHSSQPRPY